MTLDTILTAFIDFAGSRGIQIVASEQPQPPAFLDMRPLLNAEEADSAEAGLLVTIDSVVHSGESAQLGFWIPTSLKKGTWCSVGDSGDDEIASDWIPDFADEKGLIAFVARTTDNFFLQYVFEPALDEYLADKGISYEVVEKKEFCGEAAEEAFNHDLMNWLFVEFQDAGGYDITLGISGKGGAATFHANEDGFLDFDERVTKLPTGAKLTEWLESVITANS
jgi:hypothetical protein